MSQTAHVLTYERFKIDINCCVEVVFALVSVLLRHHPKERQCIYNIQFVCSVNNNVNTDFDKRNWKKIQTRVYYIGFKIVEYGTFGNYHLVLF